MVVAKTMQAAKKTKKKELEAVREQLEVKRREMLSLYEHDLRVGQRNSDEGAEDLVDRANSAHHREFLLSLSGAERDLLLEIEQAMERVDQGDFGSCVHCDEEISPRRLQAVPWARYCVGCQERSEQGLLYEG